MSKHTLPACDGPALLALLEELRRQAERRYRCSVAVVTVQEAGRDGFWLHRLLEAHSVQSHGVDPASIAVSRRNRRAKTDRIDAERLLRARMAWSRGERQVCSMVRAPSREAEDARGPDARARGAGCRAHPARQSDQGAAGDPGRVRFRAELAGATGPIGRSPHAGRAEVATASDGHDRAQIERLELILRQLAEVEAARDAALAAECPAAVADAAPPAEAMDATSRGYPEPRGRGCPPAAAEGNRP